MIDNEERDEIFNELKKNLINNVIHHYNQIFLKAPSHTFYSFAYSLYLILSYQTEMHRLS